MNETCEKQMNRFLMLDKNERIPLGVTLHLLKCPKCRNEGRLMTMAERIAARPLKISLPVSAESILDSISTLNPSWKIEPRPVSMKKWVVGGIFMIVFMLFFNFFASFFGIRNETLQLYFYLVFLGFVIFYCMLFVGTNMDFFVKKITGDENLKSMLTFG